MSDDPDFKRATRRLLFDDEPRRVQEIPGAGRSAAAEPEKHVRVKVTLNLDGDVVAHFKERSRAEGRAYQSLINQVLREFIEGSRPEKLMREIRQSLLEDESFLRELAERLAGSRVNDAE